VNKLHLHPYVKLCCCRVLRCRSRKFSKPPIGPIGAHLTLTDTKWATAGEVVLGGSLELWIVHNAKDNQVSCCCCCWCCPLSATTVVICCRSRLLLSAVG
jgi:hypothetical protein